MLANCWIGAPTAGADQTVLAVFSTYSQRVPVQSKASMCRPTFAKTRKLRLGARAATAAPDPAPTRQTAAAATTALIRARDTVPVGFTTSGDHKTRRERLCSTSSRGRGLRRS